MQIKKALIKLLVLAFLLAGASVASGQKWKKLGSKTVDLKNGRDTMIVSHREGYINKIKLSVSGASVRITRMVVTYVDGTKDTFNLAVTVEDGKSTRDLGLESKRRYIAQVDLRYGSRTLNGKKAKITLYALPAE